MSRFTTLHVASGAVISGGDFDSDIAIPQNNVNLGKVKVLPSGSTLGYYLQIFKQASRLDAVMQFSTKVPQIGNYYVPTDRNGNEVLQGWVLPYEDVDGLAQIHVRLHNLDPVTRSYDIYIDYEVTGVAISSIITEEVLSNFGSTSQTLANIPISGTLALYRAGLRLKSGAGAGFTYSGTAVTLSVPLIAGEDLIASYIKA